MKWRITWRSTACRALCADRAGFLRNAAGPYSVLHLLFLTVVLTVAWPCTGPFALCLRPATVCAVHSNWHAGRSIPLSLHPQNPHYFLFRGKPAVLITSGEHYGAVLNLDFDFVRYLDTLHADGLNLTRLFSGSYREIPGSFGITDNTLAPRPNRYICPWARSSVEGYFDGGARFDLKRWDRAYFQRLRAFVKAASDRGVVVEVNLFCPNYNDDLWRANPMNAMNNVNGVGACKADEVYTMFHSDLLAVQDAVTRKIVTSLKAFDNVYFEVCNEPYFGGVTMDWQRHIVSVITAAEAGLGHKHLISMNIANGRARVTEVVAGVCILNFHYATPPDAVAMNYALNRVIGENETGFRGNSAEVYRSEGWEFLLAGGALYNNLDYSFTASHPDGTLVGNFAPGGGSPALRHQLCILHEFLGDFDFIRMKPDTTVIRGGIPAGVSVHCLSEPGHQYAIYMHGSTPAELKLLLPAGRYRVEWLNPVTGGTVRSDTLDSSGGLSVLQSPEFPHDIALSIRRVAQS